MAKLEASIKQNLIWTTHDASVSVQKNVTYVMVITITRIWMYGFIIIIHSLISYQMRASAPVDTLSIQP